jgi:hypothetical protein
MLVDTALHAIADAGSTPAASTLTAAAPVWTKGAVVL